MFHNLSKTLLQNFLFSKSSRLLFKTTSFRNMFHTVRKSKVSETSIVKTKGFKVKRFSNGYFSKMPIFSPSKSAPRLHFSIKQSSHRRMTVFYSTLYFIETFRHQKSIHPKNGKTLYATHFRIRISSLPFLT